MRLSYLAGAAALALLAACNAQPAPVDTAAIQQTIRDKDQTFGQLVEAKNDSGMGAQYVQDAVLMPPNQPSVHGRDSIRAEWGKLMANPDAKLALTPGNIRVAASGDMAAEEGTYDLSVGGATPFTDKGKYLVIWVKSENGDWQIATDTWNSNNPPPGAGTDSTASN